MSDDRTADQKEAESNLEAAILAFAKADGQASDVIITNWIVIGSATSVDLDSDGSTLYFRLLPSSGQPFHATLGLVTYADAMYRAAVTDDE